MLPFKTQFYNLFFFIIQKRWATQRAGEIRFFFSKNWLFFYFREVGPFMDVFYSDVFNWYLVDFEGRFCPRNPMFVDFEGYSCPQNWIFVDFEDRFCLGNPRCCLWKTILPWKSFFCGLWRTFLPWNSNSIPTDRWNVDFAIDRMS